METREFISVLFLGIIIGMTILAVYLKIKFLELERHKKSPDKLPSDGRWNIESSGDGKTINLLYIPKEKNKE